LAALSTTRSGDPQGLEEAQRLGESSELPPFLGGESPADDRESAEDEEDELRDRAGVENRSRRRSSPLGFQALRSPFDGVGSRKTSSR
jgi:hypothetical protein